MVKRVLLAVFVTLLSVPWALADKHTIPAGTTVHCRLTETISTKLNYQGDRFAASVTEPLMIDGYDVIPVGSTLEGRIARLQRPGRIKGVGEMRLSLEKITFPDGHSYPLNAVLLNAYGAEGTRVVDQEGNVKGPGSKLRDLEEVGVGMGGGGFLGTLMGGFHGAVIGGAIGGGAALVDTFRRRGKELTIPAGTQLNYQLTRALEVNRGDRRNAISRRQPTPGD
jgi:hypothetical protein